MDEVAVYDLLRGRLRFADITTFNDPFEARPQYVAAFEDARRQRAAMVDYLIEIAPIDGSKTQRRQWAESWLSGKSMEEVVAVAAQRNYMRAGELYAMCLMAPEVIQTPLPWAHYADSHRGVCIHLNTESRPLSLAFPVEYQAEYPKLVVPRTHRHSMDVMRNIVLRKCDAWSYEREYRVVKLTFSGAPEISRTLGVEWDGNVAIASGDVAKAVTLGCRMNQQTRARLTDWIKSNVPHVEVWQADVHSNRYEVIRERVC